MYGARVAYSSSLGRRGLGGLRLRQWWNRGGCDGVPRHTSPLLTNDTLALHPWHDPVLPSHDLLPSSPRPPSTTLLPLAIRSNTPLHSLFCPSLPLLVVARTTVTLLSRARSAVWRITDTLLPFPRHSFGPLCDFLPRLLTLRHRHASPRPPVNWSVAHFVIVTSPPSASFMPSATRP